MIDESQFVTGWCPPEDECPDGYWCLSDGAPPGYWDPNDGCPPGCQEIPEFPVVPPNPISCEVLVNHNFYQSSVTQFLNGMYYRAEGGTSVSHKLYDAEHNYIGTAYSNTSPVGATFDGEHMYIYLNNTLRRVHSVTGVVEVINLDPAVEPHSCYRISSYNGHIVLGGYTLEVNGTFYGGGVVLNTLGEFIRVIGKPYVYGNERTAHVLSNGVMLMTAHIGEGATIELFDVTTGDPLGDLPKPTDTYTNKGYGNFVIDLGIVEGKGRFAVLSGHFSNQNNAGFRSSSNYWNSKNKVAIYDYDMNLLIELESPITNGAGGTLFGASVVRHGHYMLIGEPKVGTYQGISQPGATHLYDDNGVFIKTMPLWDAAAAPTNLHGGGGLTFSANSIRSFGAAIASAYTSTRTCTY